MFAGRLTVSEKVLSRLSPLCGLRQGYGLAADMEISVSF